MRAALAYQRDAYAHARLETPLSPYNQMERMWHELERAGAIFKNGKFNLYPLNAMLHHVRQTLHSAAYSARAWSLGVYPVTQFEEYSSRAMITRDLRGSLFVAHAEANRRSLLRTHGSERLTIKFEKIKRGVEIPSDGYWVLVVYDIDNPLEDPELIYHRYTLTKAELTQINKSSRPLVLPLSLSSAHHVHHLRTLGFETPRLLLRLAPARSNTGWMTVQSAALEAHMQPAGWTQFTRTEIGDTLQSARIDQESEVETKKPPSTIVDDIAKRHRVLSYAGFWTTSEGQIKLGEAVGSDGSEYRSIGSAAVGEFAVYRTVLAELESRRAEIEAKLAELDPHKGVGVERNALNDRLGMEAVFAVMSPHGRDSPVLKQLKRIFGDKGIPTLGDMLSGNAGLPASVSPALGQSTVDAILAAKIDMSSDREIGVSEQYAAHMLSTVRAPVWQATVSPMTLAILVSVMPNTFASDVQHTIRTTFDMKYTALRHSRAAHSTPSRVQWSGRTAPGVYTEGPLDDYERLARRLAEAAEFSASDQAMSVVIPDQSFTPEALNKLEVGTEYESKTLVARGVGPASSIFFAQREALERLNEPKSRVKFSPNNMVVFRALMGLANDGKALLIVVNRSSRQSIVLKFDAAPDHRMMVAMDLMSVMASAIRPDTYDGGQAAWSALQMAVSRSRAFDAYAQEGRASSDDVDDVDDHIAPKKKMAHVVKLMREAMQNGYRWLNIQGSVDSGELSVQDVSDDDSTASIRYDGHAGSLMIAAPIGDQPNATSAATARISVNGNDSTLSLLRVGPNVYIRSDQLDLLAAAQNEAISKPEVIATENENIHDPYNMSKTVQVSKSDALNGGIRRKLLESSSPLVVNNVGSHNSNGLMLSHDQRNDPSRYYAGWFAARNPWYNPYA